MHTNAYFVAKYLTSSWWVQSEFMAKHKGRPDARRKHTSDSDNRMGSYPEMDWKGYVDALLDQKRLPNFRAQAWQLKASHAAFCSYAACAYGFCSKVFGCMWHVHGEFRESSEHRKQKNKWEKNNKHHLPDCYATKGARLWIAMAFFEYRMQCCMNFWILQNGMCWRILEDRRRYKMHLGFNMFILSNVLTYVLQQLAIRGRMFYYISPLFCKVIVFTGPAFLHWKFWPISLSHLKKSSKCSLN